MIAPPAPSTTLVAALLAPPVDLDRPAIVVGATAAHGPTDAHDDTVITFRQLAERIDTRRRELALAERCVVVLTGDASAEWVVTYLALLAGGQVPLLAPIEAADAAGFAARWGATAVVETDDDGYHITRLGRVATTLHPDLALLLTTSGSTGAPKLVRLSHRNLLANARSIAEFQSLTCDDRSITSLPLHYSFGLSVLHSHLAVGASVVVTDRSVVDPCFRRTVADRSVTTFAGVPHTFEMLDRAGVDLLDEPSLRLVMQAGGRMSPDAVAAWAARAADRDAEFFVMYGQTEATARIAYLPPHLARRHPSAIGRAIPGGQLRLGPTEAGVGELIYTGDNVMLGYAEHPADLALGATVDELHTGDLARRIDGDLFEIVGRRARFVKPFGLRIDLDDVERQLRESHPHAVVAGDDDRIVAFTGGADVEAVRERLGAISGLPARHLVVCAGEPPRTASGKPDTAAMLTAASLAAAPSADPGATHTESVADVYAAVLGAAPVRPGDTFVSLGGDSLSYVEASIRLERVVGQLPADWHLRPVAELESADADRRRWARVDTSVVIRAIAICAVVSTHMRLWHIPGGAHTLLAIAGYNFARFVAPIESPIERLRAGLRTIGRVAIPTVVWVAIGMALFGAYGYGALVLANNYLGPASHAGSHWHFWFIEVFVHVTLLATLVVAVLGRLDRRWPLLVPGALLAVALVLRMDWSHMGDWYNLRFRTHGVAWFFALGWLIQRCRTLPTRALATILCAVTLAGFFQIAAREWRIGVMLAALIWFARVPLPRLLVRPVGALAAASMWIYLSHFTIWPMFREFFIVEVAYVLTLASGVAIWFAADRLAPRWVPLLRWSAP